MPQYEIPVTEMHIEEGERFDPGACPIALALNDGLGEEEDVAADMGHITASLHPRNTHAEPTVLIGDNGIAEFVSAFDAGDVVQPINLRIDTDAKTMAVIEEE